MLRALATLALCAALVGCQSVATYFGGDAAPGGSPLYDAGADDAGDATRPDGPDIPDGPPTPDGPLDAQLPRGPCAPAEIFRQSLNEESFDLSLDSLGQPHVVYLSDLLIASGIYHGVGTSSSWNTADIGLSLTLTRLAGIVDGTDRLHLLYGAASSGPVYRVRDATSAAWSVVDTLDDQLIRTDSVSLTTDTTTGTVYGAVSGRSLFESAIQRFSLEAKSSVPFICAPAPVQQSLRLFAVAQGTDLLEVRDTAAQAWLLIKPLASHCTNDTAAKLNRAYGNLDAVAFQPASTIAHLAHVDVSTSQLAHARYDVTGANLPSYSPVAAGTQVTSSMLAVTYDQLTRSTVIVYGDRGSNELRIARSIDGGMTWSSTKLVASTITAGARVRAIANAGRLHVLWRENTDLRYVCHSL